MKNWYSCLFALLLFISCGDASEQRKLEELAQARSAKQQGKTIEGKVVGISDGDTFKILADGNQTIKVRLHGIDAPEKKQDYGNQAQQKLSELIFSKQVQVVKKNEDRYGRLVGVVYVGGLNVNEELLRTGYAWHYHEYDKSEQWETLQQQAMKKRSGLWQQRDPTPPWQWRKDQRDAQKLKQQNVEE
jgi:endonuclease YncB( thermonuclease family)